ncbi:hypothetical protein FNH05_21515 [Amycolatopsis rhizosphaerae]|uniref:Uncharacterized protein n=1 Tax=Amycolatopsis rhizosphaerae TaxID=2053003 RepID=A0A558C696_9PSEU|nr:hypothetical protein [Amycolatopsis rhizosphaerae]TVT44314.1 hypothetical protein FNH05_21515 [Amycolatopsis rhizosphaerae]
MNVPELLVRLYPPAIRQRWGSEIAHEARLAGPRSWFDTATGAAKLWLRPSDWPETTIGQTSRVLATALVAVITAAAGLLRAADPTPLTAPVGHLAASVWLVPVLAGLALAAPVPSLRPAAFTRLAAVASRTLALPVLAVAALVLTAHSGLIHHPRGAVHILLLGYYWATLGFAGIHLCLLTARLGRIAVVPSTRRLRLALLFAGTGLALAATRTLAAPVQGGTVLLSCGLAALAAPLLILGQDLRRIPQR